MWVVTAREQSAAIPRMTAPVVVKRVRPPTSHPRTAAYAAKTTATIVNVMEPAMRRVIQPIGGCGSRHWPKGFRLENHEWYPFGSLGSVCTGRERSDANPTCGGVSRRSHSPAREVIKIRKGLHA